MSIYSTKSIKRTNNLILTGPITKEVNQTEIGATLMNHPHASMAKRMTTLVTIMSERTTILFRANKLRNQSSLNCSQLKCTAQKRLSIRANNRNSMLQSAQPLFRCTLSLRAVVLQLLVTRNQTKCDQKAQRKTALSSNQLSNLRPTSFSLRT